MLILCLAVCRQVGSGSGASGVRLGRRRGRAAGTTRINYPPRSHWVLTNNFRPYATHIERILVQPELEISVLFFAVIWRCIKMATHRVPPYLHLLYFCMLFTQFINTSIQMCSINIFVIWVHLDIDKINLIDALETTKTQCENKTTHLLVHWFYISFTKSHFNFFTTISNICTLYN